MKWNFSIQNNGLMSKIKQPNKNWINDHNFKKDLTFKILEKKTQNKCPFQLSTTLTTSIQVFLAVTHRVVFVDTSLASFSHPRRVIVSLSRPRRVSFTESSSSSHRLVESSSSSQPCLTESSSCSYGASSSHPRRVIESSSSHEGNIESSSSSVEAPLENSSVYLLFLSVGRKMTPFPETVSDPKSGLLWDNPGPFHASTMTHFRWYTQIKQSHI